MKALLGLWFNGFTAFSIQPLRFATIIGILCAVSGFLYGIYTIIKRLINPAVPVGFSSLMSAVVFLGGMIMLMLGLIGEYVGRIYISLNNSPQYVIREVIGQKEMRMKSNVSNRQQQGILLGLALIFSCVICLCVSTIISGRMRRLPLSCCIRILQAF